MENLVSVIIPAYQEEKKIGRCLRSILASTYQNLQVIVVNDGSTDRTGEIVRKIKRKRESGTVSIELININNGGSGHARNCGLRRAKGKYISFVDADDMIHPQMIERLVQSIGNGSDMASCGIVLCDEMGRGKVYQKRLRRKLRCPAQALEMAMWSRIQMNLGGVLFRKEKIIDQEGQILVACPEDTVCFEDFSFICEYLSRCNGSWEALPFQGYLYCRHDGSRSYEKWSAMELSHALQPMMAVGNRMDDENFISHKLQYTFRFMALWYEWAFRSGGRIFTPECSDRKICMRELERFVDLYMKSADVVWYRKLAVWIVRKHSCLGWVLARTVGWMVRKHSCLGWVLARTAGWIAF